MRGERGEAQAYERREGEAPAMKGLQHLSLTSGSRSIPADDPGPWLRAVFLSYQAVMLRLQDGGDNGVTNMR